MTNEELIELRTQAEDGSIYSKLHSKELIERAQIKLLAEIALRLPPLPDTPVDDLQIEPMELTKQSEPLLDNVKTSKKGKS